ncbi:hypothetical protein OHV05_06750 [Kitasatospora sp. NBC_00070]
MDWINPKYAELVARHRTPLDPQQVTYGRPLPEDAEPGDLRGFVLVAGDR